MIYFNFLLISTTIYILIRLIICNINKKEIQLERYDCIVFILLLLIYFLGQLSCYFSGGVYLSSYGCTYVKYSYEDLILLNEVPANITGKPNIMLNTSDILKNKLWLKNILK